MTYRTGFRRCTKKRKGPRAFNGGYIHIPVWNLARGPGLGGWIKARSEQRYAAISLASRGRFCGRRTEMQTHLRKISISTGRGATVTTKPSWSRSRWIKSPDIALVPVTSKSKLPVRLVSLSQEGHPDAAPENGRSLLWWHCSSRRCRRCSVVLAGRASNPGSGSPRRLTV